MRSLRTGFALALLLALAACSTIETALEPAGELATSAAAACDRRPNNTHAKLLECVTLDGVLEHLAAFQAIADANGGTRAAGTPGYDASAAYVAERMTAAGYVVTQQAFEFIYLRRAVLQQTAPITAPYPTGAFTGSGVGDVMAPVTPVDVNLALPRENSSGCEASDFAGFPVGHIALLQRGTCTYAEKAQNAEAAGAIGVVVFNQGNVPSREAVVVGTLGGSIVNIPVVGASFADGAALAEPGSIARIQTFAPEVVTQVNVIAETRGGDESNVVMVGAHLDSVPTGPGIQDNGSGSAAILETAIQMARVPVRNKVRFAWWGASEPGLVGSTAYVAALSSEELAAIALYLNFDIIGSPNFVRFVYDGDDSDGQGAGPGPAGSAHIEATFERFYRSRHLPFKGTDLSGRSDDGPFIAAGIPVGGVLTGAEGVKTADEAALFGGTAGVAYDPCFHLACDTIDNVGLVVLDQNADAVAYATLQYAMNTRDVNGVRGRGNFRPNPTAGPDPMAAPTE